MRHGRARAHVRCTRTGRDRRGSRGHRVGGRARQGTRPRACRLLSAARRAPARQLDARRLGELGESFDTVLDCGLFHVFDPGDRCAYVASLASATTPGARYFMLCFSDEQPGDWGPHRISRSEIVAALADGWRIEAIDPARIEVTIDPEGIRAWSVAATRV